MEFIENFEKYGYDFIAGEFLPGGKDEYYLRNKQLAEIFGANWAGGFRHLTAAEINALEKNNNVCYNWNDVYVRDVFDPSLVRNNYFAGLVRLGEIKKALLKYHDFTVPVGITRSRIIACDIGSNCAVHNCSYISHYIINNYVILYKVNELDATNHNKAGEGILKEGEGENVRVWIDLINESGGRGILPFKDIIPADAALWALNRNDAKLMSVFKNITQNSCDARRGYYGTIGHHTVIKHCYTIKDVCVGDYAYIKGANKLKNLTIKSIEDEPTQIGEGVELVNGIIGTGCHIFYGCKAVRFVLCNNSNLKYGARLLNSILGDNSTISCCEVLNNLVYPAHEQHHNNSFLIASLIAGQSNIAAGSTVGSNHNSRGNDGELFAGRGFWAGLSSTLKHNSKFASYCLLTKGNYTAELSIPLPFSLVTHNAERTRLEVMPAYWWMYNMYALERNNWKYKTRDKRKYPVQFYEKDYLAPDTVYEIILALTLLEQWKSESRTEEVYAPPFLLERSKLPVRIIKCNQAVNAYREMLLYYAVKTLVLYFSDSTSGSTSGSAVPVFELFNKFQLEDADSWDGSTKNIFKWKNLGGQLVPEYKTELLKDKIRAGELNSWEEIHSEYKRLQGEYAFDKAKNALSVLRCLICGNMEDKIVITDIQWNEFVTKTIQLSAYITEQVHKSKEKDYLDPFRNITYKDSDERDAVLGKLEDNPFIQSVKTEQDQLALLLKKAMCP